MQRERLALLHLKVGFVDRYGMLSFWTTANCQWKSIVCSNLTHHILVLDLHGDWFAMDEFFSQWHHQQLTHGVATLRGFKPQLESISRIPSQFGLLSHLNYLNLEGNSLEGSIPYQLGNLSKLQHLDLKGNSLEANVPSQLGKQSNLQKLYLGYGGTLKLHDGVFDLSWNKFTSSMIFHLVSNISYNLFELDLCGKNLLEAPASNHFGLMMHFLERLDLSSNRLKGGALESFIDRNSLREFYLSYNLSMFSNLKILDLSVNRLSGKIPDSSKFPPQLESLSLESNSLEGGVPKSLGSTCTLRSLHLSNNSFNEELPLIMQNLSGCARSSLQELELRMNQIKGTLPDFSVFSSLKTLSLDENRLNGKIPKYIRFPTQLETLKMNLNSLGGVISDFHFALEFSQNWTLKSCKLGPTFPKWFHTQNDIEILDISNCGISDSVPEWFWCKVAIQGMTKMNISFNNLKGTIPNFPLEVTPHFVVLASNQFEGPVPPFLRGSAFLDLFQNKFSDFSSFLCANGTVEALGQLDLSNNQSISNHLAYLDLSHNNFSGTLPTSMGALVELQALLLRNNSLTKEIPFSLRNCIKLVMFDLGENRLAGRIPSWIEEIYQDLQILSFRKNNLSGSLPVQLCYLQGIQLLDLSLNSLSGRIPKCLKNFTSMTQKTSLTDYTHQGYSVSIRSIRKYMNYYDLYSLLTWKGSDHIFLNNELLLLKSIDLSSNQLSEEIPIEIEDLFEPISLNLSRNNLTGEIPSNLT
ncbi:hypothetical protein LR48_Vigan10g112300 [Vigna angularis]|uniref:Leucine-rich repeat-containing N-terminal plant-type domain-containing protein n=1 Tax=Phaseolus angularis TaxID=3914 RepID=A0A0L9VJK5_PHAAN|nr:hypothetical protein LR48_Vigan10g112300 [Vigna angularis]